MKEFIQDIRSSIQIGDFRKVLELVKGPVTDKLGLNHDVRNTLFAHTMTLNYGPVGMHESYLDEKGIKVEWMEDVLPKSYEAEIVEDMMSLIASFSAKVYGRRSADRRTKKKPAA